MYLIEWTGAALGTLGAVWMALCLPSSRFAWWLWLLSNCLLIVFFYSTQHWGVLVNQVTLLLTSVLGIYRYCYRERTNI